MGRQGGPSVVLGSGNLGLSYLVEERRRLMLEEMNARPRQVVVLNRPTNSA
jgi:hypothetical protein